MSLDKCCGMLPRNDTQNNKCTISLCCRLHWFEHRSSSHLTVILRSLGLARATLRTPHKRASPSSRHGADPRHYVMAAIEELLSRLVNLEVEAVQARQRQTAAEQELTAAQQQIHQLSSGGGTSRSSSVTRVIKSHQYAHAGEAEVVRFGAPCCGCAN